MPALPGADYTSLLTQFPGRARAVRSLSPQRARRMRGVLSPDERQSRDQRLSRAGVISVDLGRFVLLDFVPGNGETWFLARCFELLRRHGVRAGDRQQEIVGVVSFSDPFCRTDQSGRLVHRGHIGTIYQAFNGVYLGQMDRRTIRLLPDGSVLSARTMQKIRSREHGFGYETDLLRRFGADEPWEGSTAWLHHWMARLTRTARHPGMHKYAWPVQRIARRFLPPSRPYPKFSFPQLEIRYT